MCPKADASVMAPMAFVCSSPPSSSHLQPKLALPYIDTNPRAVLRSLRPLENMYHDIDSELIRAWQLLHELADSNQRNRELAVGLRNVADTLKVSPADYLLPVCNLTLYIFRARRRTSQRECLSDDSIWTSRKVRCPVVARRVGVCL